MDLKDKIFGAIYGCAIGDALGLATEFMSRQEVAFRYPRGVDDYSDIYRDAHRAQHEPGEWTAETELLLRILEEALEVGALDANQMAASLKRSYVENKIEMPSQYHFIMRNPEYTEHPIEVAAEVWREMGANRASNEAVNRSLIAGLFSNDPVNRGIDVCRVTHADPLCVGSCAVMAKMSHDLMWNNRVTPVEELKKIAEEIDERISPFIDWATEPTLSSLDLDDLETFWYTRKTMGSGLWPIFNNKTTAEALEAILAEGGDTNINASAALILIGVRDGFSAFPKNLVEGLKNRDRLDKIANRLTERFANRDYSD